jgi:hypothetical protein
VPAELKEQPAVDRAPHPGDAIAVTGDDAAAVGAEAGARHGVGGRAELKQLPTGIGVPQPQHAIMGRRQERPPVRPESRGGDVVPVSLQGQQESAVGTPPDADAAVVVADEDARAVTREGQRRRRGVAPREDQLFIARRGIDGAGMVIAGGERQPSPVRAEAHRDDRVAQSRQGEQGPAGGDLPKPHRAIAETGRDPGPVRAEGGGLHGRAARKRAISRGRDPAP